MKSFLIATMFLVSLLGTPFAHALKIEVIPLKLKAEAEAMGIQIKGKKEKVILVSGKMAMEMAEIGKFSFNQQKEILVLTGKEVDLFLKNPYHAGKNLGKGTIVATGDVIDFVYEMSKEVVQTGKAVVITSYEQTKKMTKRVYKEMKSLSKNPIKYITDLGIEVVKGGKKFVLSVGKFACKLINIIPGIKLKCEKKEEA